MENIHTLVPANRTETLELRRESISKKTTANKKSALGQFMTAAPIADFMAGLFENVKGRDIRLLDAGAGMGSLTAAFERMAGGNEVASIAADAWEIDPDMLPHLHETLDGLAATGRHFSFCIRSDNFVSEASREIALAKPPRFTHAILNPPYKKLKTKSDERLALRDAGIETSNFYSAFVALAVMMLEDGGEIVAITPRSFCNGTYFRPFRQILLRRTALLRFHVFTSRTTAFKGDDVLQENIIFHLRKGAPQGQVVVSESSDSTFSDVHERSVPFGEVVLADDRELIFHLVPEDDDGGHADVSSRFSNSLEDLGLDVSTGPVVDFRLKAHLSGEPRQRSVPLIYPLHFERGFVSHPKAAAKKANWIEANDDTGKWLMPAGHYVIVRRLSSKEERRRLVPAVFDAERIQCERVGFENHLNVFHRKKAGLDPEIARGLAVWLGSTAADDWLRRFNGHTQVNAGDLRALRYPDLATLAAWGRAVGEALPPQDAIDELVEASCRGTAKSACGNGRQRYGLALG
jgi:adenine-specific DNA-methyltransferase